MNLFVLFPRIDDLSSKGIDTHRVWRNVIKQQLSQLSNIKDLQVTYLLEDTLANEFLKDVNCKKSVITLLCKHDVDFLQRFDISNILSQDVYEKFNVTPNMTTVDVATMFPIDNKLVKNDKDLFIRKRINAYKQRHKYALANYIKTCEGVMIFRANNASDRVPAISNMSKIGDGKLFIEIELDTGYSENLYGGVVLDDDTRNEVLAM